MTRQPEPPAITDRPTAGTPLLEVSELTKDYRIAKRHTTRALADASLVVGRGEVVGLLGANGAGKTTLIKCICGLVTPSSGTVVIDGFDMCSHRREAGRRVAALLEGNRNIYSRLTVIENLEFFLRMSGRSPAKHRALIDDLLATLVLGKLADAQARFLSRGQQQRLAIGCALVKATPLVLLDEPTLGLDVASALDLTDVLRRITAQDDRAVLISSHDMRLIDRLCDRVVVVAGGRIVADDRITRLAGVDGAPRYHLRASGQLRPETQHELELSGALVERDDHGASVWFHAVDRDRASTMLRLVQQDGMSVEALIRDTPDLESVFLRLSGSSPECA